MGLIVARCYICNTHLETVELDENNKILPCDVCTDVIEDTVSEDATSDLFLELGYTLEDESQ